jgi:hypothetical protein
MKTLSVEDLVSRFGIDLEYYDTEQDGYKGEFNARGNRYMESPVVIEVNGKQLITIQMFVCYLEKENYGKDPHTTLDSKVLEEKILKGIFRKK